MQGVEMSCFTGFSLYRKSSIDTNNSTLQEYAVQGFMGITVPFLHRECREELRGKGMKTLPTKTYQVWAMKSGILTL